MSRVAIVGGGIAGLSIAHELRKSAPDVDVVVLERSERTGGNIRTAEIDGYRCECGPDGFLDNAPDTLRLVREVGLDDRLLPSSDAARRRFIFRRGRLHEVPLSPARFATSSLLSAAGKVRVLCEPFAQRPADDDESIYDFAARRIGQEAAEAMIDPMVSGIFAGDAHALSLHACFGKMWEMERQYGSLVRAMLAKRGQRKKGDAVGSPAGRLTSFRGGMSDLIDGLTRSLGGAIRTGSPVLEIRPPSTFNGYVLALPGGHVEADAVVVAGSATQTSALVRPFDITLSSALSRIPSAPLAVVCLGYDSAALIADRGPLNGFGFLVPRSEGVRTLGALWETSIYENRAPEGKSLLRVMIGGALDRDILDLGDAELLSIVRADLHKTMGLRVAPEFVHIVRHPRGIPQYTLGHLSRLERIDHLSRIHSGLFFAGNSYRGVAINACIADAAPLARRVLAQLPSLTHTYSHSSA